MGKNISGGWSKRKAYNCLTDNSQNFQKLNTH